MNEALAAYSEEEKVGVGIASGLRHRLGSQLFANDLLNRILLKTASAAESRLDGCPLPTMSSSGAGTKGLVVILPISETAKAISADHLTTVRAVAFGHLVNRYINAYVGKLSPMCSCVMCSSTAAAAGIAFLLGGTDEQIGGAIRNMSGTVTGMICDGGKVGCALKAATGSAAAYGPNIIAAVEVILGTFEAQGKLPVNIPVLDMETRTYTDEIAYERGHGLTYAAKEPIKPEEPVVPTVIAEGWSGYTTWVLTDDGTITFTSSGETLENGESNLKNYWKVNGVLTLPWGAYADQITKVVINDGIHDLGQMAFYELPNLTEVVLGKDVTEIRHYAFKNCASLVSINLENVDDIREGAFYGCSALTEINLGENVNVEDWAFSKTPYASLNP